MLLPYNEENKQNTKQPSRNVQQSCSQMKNQRHYLRQGAGHFDITKIQHGLKPRKHEH